MIQSLENAMGSFNRPLVAVVGDSSAKPPIQEIAEQVGFAIGNRDWNLLCGGGGGVMEAACKGFQNAPKKDRAVAVGVLPSEDRSFANPFVDVAIPTGLGIARNAIIARAAYGLVAVGGSSGTLSEIAFAWQMGRPIVAIAGSGGWSEKLAGVALDGRRNDVVREAKTADEALDILASMFGL